MHCQPPPVDTNQDVDGNQTNESVVGFNFRPTETVAYKLEYKTTKKEGSEAENFLVGSIAVGF